MTGTQERSAAAVTAEERAAEGRGLRSGLPRSAHGDWEPAADRPDPLDVLAQQEETRVPQLLGLRHERMAASPFAFFRGAAAVMAADLAATPSTGLRVQLCGDAHLANFGAFASPDRTLVFDLNDFDETAPGPWEWDLKRLAASIAIAGRGRDFSDADRDRAVRAATRSFREAIRRFAGMPLLDVWYARLDMEEIAARWRDRVPPAQAKAFDRNIAKAHGKTSDKAARDLTERVDGHLRIAADPPLVVPIEDVAEDADAAAIEARVRAMLAEHRRSAAGAAGRLLERYDYVHAAHKVVGVGSVGTRCWVALLLGSGEDDPLFLQIKEATRSVLEPYTGASRYRHHGRRVVEGQWLMQASSDVLLGWVSNIRPDGVRDDYYVRQLWDWKRSADLDRMVPGALAAYGEMCGWTLARAHARSGDAIAIGAYAGGGEALDRALTRFAEAYADQNERDHAAFAAAHQGEGL